MNIDLIQGVKASYLRAFAQVAKILVPTLEITEIKAETIIKLTEGSRTHDVVVKGFDPVSGCKIEVKRVDPIGGEGWQIATRYISAESNEVIATNKVWYYAFNWQGLMATEK
jgi:hypothetical protein